MGFCLNETPAPERLAHMLGLEIRFALFVLRPGWLMIMHLACDLRQYLEGIETAFLVNHCNRLHTPKSDFRTKPALFHQRGRGTGIA